MLVRNKRASFTVGHVSRELRSPAAVDVPNYFRGHMFAPHLTTLYAFLLIKDAPGPTAGEQVLLHTIYYYFY